MNPERYREGIQLLQNGNALAALSVFNQLIEQYPEHPDYLSERGVCYLHLGKKDLALIDLDRALALDQLNPYRYSSRAYLKDSMGDVHGAIEDYKKAIALDPDDAVAHNNLGLLEEKLGYTAEAQQRFKKADLLADGESYSKEVPNENPYRLIENTKVEVEEEVIPKQQSKWSIIKMVIVDKKSRREFFRFIFRGFKIK